MTEMRANVSAWVVAAVLAVSGGLVSWGVNQANITVLQQRANQVAIDIRANEAQLATQDREIAVITTEYSEILRRLDAIDSKLDGSQK